ncbi:MAG TPA: hypothetical protein VFA76_10530 [Terriglobales bacterium]|nr:hypothetical protein [Terriglobales bacterium]
MKVALIAVLLVGLSSATITRPSPKPQALALSTARHKPPTKGKWYMAENGHAVYCFGRVVTLPAANGEIKRVATFCSGDSPIVELRD